MRCGNSGQAAGRSSSVGRRCHARIMEAGRLYADRRRLIGAFRLIGRGSPLRGRETDRIGRGAQRLVGRQARAVPGDPDGRPACRVRRSHRQLREGHQAPAWRLAEGPAGFEVKIFHDGWRTAADTADRPEWRHLRGRKLCCGRIRVLRPSGTCTLGRQLGLRHRAQPAVRDRVLSARAEPELSSTSPTTSRVVRFPYPDGDLVRDRRAPRSIVPDLPQGAGQLPGKGHWTRDIAFSRDGADHVRVGRLLLERRRTDGENETDRARDPGLQPGRLSKRTVSPAASATRSRSASRRSMARLWTSVNERDGLGDNLVPDYVTAGEPRPVLWLAMVLHRARISIRGRPATQPAHCRR